MRPCTLALTLCPARRCGWRLSELDGAGWLAVGDSGLELVDSLADAKVLWTADIKAGIYTDPQNVADFPITHYCAPSVADDIVVYVFPDTTPDAPLDEVLVEKAKKGKNWNEETQKRVERGCRQTGDDVVYAVDANTGKKIWEHRFSGKGQSLIYNGNYWAAPIIADGKVYVPGPAGSTVST